MPNRGGFSWKRLTGISAAKARISRRTGIPFTKSGRQRKIDRLVTGGGCLLPSLLTLLLIGLSCSSAGTTPRPTSTPRPSRTPAPSATVAPSRTPRPPMTFTPSATVASTPTITPTAPATKTVANAGANLRAGPGTNYPKIGGVTAGQQLDLIGRNPTGDWYQLRSGAWIYSNLVDGAPAALPIAANIQAPPVSVPAVAQPTARGLPSAAASTCPCDQGNTINCADLDAWAAQSCYLRCRELTGRDVHGLDRDNDGSACEWKD